MDGCIYRTKDGECDLYAEGGKFKAFCDAEHCDNIAPSNADRIRSMSDEELCEFIGFATQDAFAYDAGLRDHMMIYPFGTHEETMAWLRQEAAK